MPSSKKTSKETQMILKRKKKSGKRVTTDKNTTLRIKHEDRKVKRSSKRRSKDIEDDLFQESQESSSMEAMLALLKECMLAQKWEEASRILQTICLYQHPDTVYHWKCGTHVLQNHPQGSRELVEQLLQRMTKINNRNRQKKRLEHALYHLSQGELKRAHDTISQRLPFMAGSTDAAQEDFWEHMASLYKGLIEYILWCEEKRKVAGEETSDSADTHAKNALKEWNLKFDEPGVWDVFVTKAVEIHESLGDINVGLELLESYCRTHPGNPNAHVYLYNYCKEHQPDNKAKLLQILKKLTSLLPAEKYTLEYAELVDSPSVVLPALFNMLDYTTCSSDTAAWRALGKCVLDVLKRYEDVAIIVHVLH
ncbi:TATA box-binding protein-associated factor RNA polymerase I subunit A-like [Diadema antillarum]|uniref:TATA box-binding protein-associated factor RNA polymerase I subunit A-like n=1 Tax=Diadema antillarum TaxID=105358 RepID=UPI003A887054